jgi:sugar lactone lactonase YvrE
MVATRPNRRQRPSIALGIVLAALMLGSCGGASSSISDEASTNTTSVAPTTTTTTEATTTTSGPASTTTAAQTALEKLGYPVSDEYRVETVITGLDSGTGGLAVDADGVLYQADFGYSGHVGNSVYRILPDGTVETFAQSDDFSSLTMTTFGPDGTLYQSSYGSDKVFRIAPDGTPTLVAEGLRGPAGIVVLEDGTLYVEAYDSNTLHRVLPDGTVEDVVFDRRFNGINGLVRGPDGTLYLIDHKDGSLFAVDEVGGVTKLHQFDRPTSHGAYLDGSLYITSRGSYVVFRYDIATGEAEIIAGNGEPGTSDGIGSDASFGRLNAIAVGPDGAMYVNHGDGTDINPLSIRRITRTP